MRKRVKAELKAKRIAKLSGTLWPATVIILDVRKQMKEPEFKDFKTGRKRKGIYKVKPEAVRVNGKPASETVVEAVNRLRRRISDKLSKSRKRVMRNRSRPHFTAYNWSFILMRPLLTESVNIYRETGSGRRELYIEDVTRRVAVAVNPEANLHMKVYIKLKNALWPVAVTLKREDAVIRSLLTVLMFESRNRGRNLFS